MAFRDGPLNAKQRNFKDEILKNVILKLSKNFDDTLFLMHTYKEKWAYFFYLNNISNVLPFSQLTLETIQKLNVHEKSFKTLGVKADLNLEVIYTLIENSTLFITAGNTGLGCFVHSVWE